ncbi:hypothetical protein V1477_002722 [Vespula maculifrons]|uniref:Secreted protein n=1 Tax=Vespula maculifrons TaxID=7453 RepID=A0ABD2CVF0_VESMC
MQNKNIQNNIENVLLIYLVTIVLCSLQYGNCNFHIFMTCVNTNVRAIYRLRSMILHGNYSNNTKQIDNKGYNR